MNSTTPPLSRAKSLLASAAVFSGAACAVLFVAGCGRRPIIVQAPPATVIQAPATPAAPAPSPGVVVLREAPPPPRTETPPPAPSSDYVWIPGYWSSRDDHPEWVSGHWEQPPRSGATWVPSRWERRPEGYVYTPGYWQ